jgi:hypothetical protein
VAPNALPQLADATQPLGRGQQRAWCAEYLVVGADQRFVADDLALSPIDDRLKGHPQHVERLLEVAFEGRAVAQVPAFAFVELERPPLEHGQAMHRNCAAYGSGELGGRRRLGQVAVATVFDDADSALQAGIAGDDDYRDVEIELTDGAQERNAVDARHVQVGDYRTDAQPAFEQVKGFRCARRCFNAVARPR